VRIRSLVAVALAPALLAGCNDDPASDDERTASGQVLEGSASDAMLPLDQVKSTPPLAKSTGSGDGEDGDDDAAEDPAAALDSGEGPGENPIFEEGFEG
jgi:hypothetical protein